MKVEVKKAEPKPNRGDFRHMKDGDVGRIVSSMYFGTVVMRVYDKVVALDMIGNYWGLDASHEVELLQPGDQVTLTVE